MIVQRFRIAPRTAISLTRMLFGAICLGAGSEGVACYLGHLNAAGAAALGVEPLVDAMAAVDLVLALSLLTGAWLHRLACLDFIR